MSHETRRVRDYGRSSNTAGAYPGPTYKQEPIVHKDPSQTVSPTGTSPSYYDINGSLVSTGSPFFQGGGTENLSGVQRQAELTSRAKALAPLLQNESFANPLLEAVGLDFNTFDEMLRNNPSDALNLVANRFLPTLNTQNFFGEGGLLAEEDFDAFSDFVDAQERTRYSIGAAGQPLIRSGDFATEFADPLSGTDALTAFRAFEEFNISEAQKITDRAIDIGLEVGDDGVITDPATGLEVDPIDVSFVDPEPDAIDFGSSFGEAFPDFDLTDPSSLVDLVGELGEFYKTDIGKLFLNDGVDVDAGLSGLIVGEGVTQEQFDSFNESFATFRDESGILDPPDTGAGTDTGGEFGLSDIQKLFETTFGEGSTAQELIDSLTGDLKTQEEITGLVDTATAPLEAAFQNFVQPAAIAQGTEAGGGLGSGVEGASLRAASTFGTQISEVARNTRSAAEQQNLAIRAQALEFAKTPAQVAEIYAKTGVALASITEIQTQADVNRANATYTDINSWATSVLSEANVQYLQEQTTGLELDNLYKSFNLAAIEQGFDADKLASQTKYWMEVIGADNPFYAMAMALIDMQTLAYY